MNKTLYARYLVVIGSQPTVITLDGDNQIISYDEAPSSALSIDNGLGKSESNFYNDASALVCATIQSDGTVEILSDTCNLIHAMQAIPIKDNIEIKSETASMLGRIYRIVMSSSEEDKNYTNTECIGYICKRAAAISDNTTTYSHLIANGAATNRIEVSSSNWLELRTYDLADMGIASISKAQSNLISETDQQAILQAVETILMKWGFSESNSYDLGNMAVSSIIFAFGDATEISYNLATLQSINSTSADGVSIIFSNTFTNDIKVYDAIQASSDNEQKSDNFGQLTIWYLPIQMGTDLYVRQIFEKAIPNGTNLEVN